MWKKCGQASACGYGAWLLLSTPCGDVNPHGSAIVEGVRARAQGPVGDPERAEEVICLAPVALEALPQRLEPGIAVAADLFALARLGHGAERLAAVGQDGVQRIVRLEQQLLLRRFQPGLHWMGPHFFFGFRDVAKPGL